MVNRGLRTLTHETFILDRGTASEMENDRHVVLVIGGIKASDVDERVSNTIPKVLREQRRFPILGKPDCVASHTIRNTSNAWQGGDCPYHLRLLF